jgi:hypothetical protein
MKIKLFTLLILIAGFMISADIQAQKKWGARAGWSSAGTFNDGDRVQSSIGGFYVGFQRKSRLFGPLLVTSGLEYAQNGHRDNDDNYRRLNYISIPVGLRVGLGPVFATGGIAGNFRVAEKVFVDGEEIDDNSDLFDAPVYLGAGINILIFQIEARYHWGLIDVNDGNKNQYLQLGLSIFAF